MWKTKKELSPCTAEDILLYVVSALYIIEHDEVNAFIIYNYSRVCMYVNSFRNVRSVRSSLVPYFH